MDIEPLWALGGWFLFPNHCMASAAPKSDESHTTHKSLHPALILSLTLVFALLLLLATPLSNPSSSSMASKRLLLADTTTTTTNLQPKETTNSHNTATSSSTSTRARTRSEFGADAHEVPSGPNPISN